MTCLNGERLSMRQSKAAGFRFFMSQTGENRDVNKS